MSAINKALLVRIPEIKGNAVYFVKPENIEEVREIKGQFAVYFFHPTNEKYRNSCQIDERIAEDLISNLFLVKEDNSQGCFYLNLESIYYAVLVKNDSVSVILKSGKQYNISVNSNLGNILLQY